MKASTSVSETVVKNSFPAFLVKLQSSLESAGYIRQVLGELSTNSLDFQVEQLRRNFKFRKLILKTGSDRYVMYIHYTRRGIRNLVWFLTQAPDIGVNTPTLLSANTGLPYYLRHASINAVTNYIEGEIFEGSTPVERLETLGVQFAHLHKRRSSKYGPLMSNTRTFGHHWTQIQKYWKHGLTQLYSYSDLTADISKNEMLDWFRENGENVKRRKTFNLCHGDPAGGNFLHKPDGSVYLIDCDHINFGFGAMEIATALLQDYCMGNMSRRERLVDSYLQHCSSDDQTDWTDNHRIYTAMALFRLSQRKLQWSKKCEAAGKTNPVTRNKGIRYWKTLNHLVTANSRSDQSWQDVFSHYDAICSQPAD